MHDGRIAFDAIGGSSSIRILGNSTARMKLTIYAPQLGSVTISNEPNVQVGDGIFLTAGMAPLYFDVDFHGNCVQREWYIIYSSSGEDLSWIETLCHEQEHDHAHDSTARVGAKRGY